MTRLKSAMCGCLSALAIAALPVMSQVNAQPAEQRAPGMIRVIPLGPFED
jgi:hypothetical protein